MRWLPGFLTLSVLWGSSFALIKVAVEGGVPPLWVALARCLFGALTVWVVCVLQRAPVSRHWATWAHAFVVGGVLNAAPSALFAYGERHVSSVLAGVLNATTPLTAFLFVLAVISGERPSGRRIAGLGVGLAGVLVVAQVWQGGARSTLDGVLACIAATTCLGMGFAYTRRFFSGLADSAATLTAVQLTCATLQLAVVAPLVEMPSGPPTGAAVAALAALGALGTGIAFLLNLRVIRSAGPTVASSVTYVIPVWSTVIGATVLGEPVGWSTVVGGLFVIVGVFLIQSSPRRPAVLTR